MKNCIPEKIYHLYRLSYEHSNKYYNVTDQIYDHQHGMDKTDVKLIKEKLSEPVNYNESNMNDFVSYFIYQKIKLSRPSQI